MNRHGVRLAFAHLVLVGCGRTGAPDVLDAGSHRPGSDAPSPDGAVHANGPDARPDSADAVDAQGQTDGTDSGCGLGTPGVRCLATAGREYLNGAIAVDDSYVYWAEVGQTPELSVLMRVPRSGGVAVTLGSGNPGANLVTDGSALYWAESITNPNIGPNLQHIVRMPVSGGTASTLATFPAPFNWACVAVDDTSVYWTQPFTDAGAVVRVAKTGGAPSPLTPGGMNQTGYTSPIALDSTGVYWVDFSDGLMKVSKDGGAPVALYAPPDMDRPGPMGQSCGSLTIAGDALFLLLGGGLNANILRLSTGGAASVLDASASPFPASLAGYPGGLVWLTGSRLDIYGLVLDGGAPRMLASPVAAAIEDLAVASDGTPFWTTDRQVQTVAPRGP
jgi:hypothetical protein